MGWGFPVLLRKANNYWVIEAHRPRERGPCLCVRCQIIITVPKRSTYLKNNTVAPAKLHNFGAGHKWM